MGRRKKSSRPPIPSDHNDNIGVEIIDNEEPSSSRGTNSQRDLPGQENPNQICLGNLYHKTLKRRRGESEDQAQKRRDADKKRKATNNEQKKKSRAKESVEEARLRKAARNRNDREARARESEALKQSRLIREKQCRGRRANMQLSRETALISIELDENVVPEHYCGDMNLTCTHCKAKHFVNELPRDGSFTVCCNKGSVQLPRIETDRYVKSLLDGTDPDSKVFMENIRSYNCAFGFVSVGVNLNMPACIGPYCFRIHGQMYHRTSTVHPDEGEKRSFSQLYILDEELAIAERLADPANSGCKSHIMEKLTTVMRSNPFAAAYKMMHEVEETEVLMAERDGRNPPKISMALLQNRKQDKRRYNAQRCNEVAVIFTSSDGEPPLDRDLRIHLKTDNVSIPKMQQVSILHKNLDALCYPLLFPNGEQGWGEDVMLSNPRGTGERARKRVTLKMYYSFYLQIRDYFNPMLSAGRLTQQYVVDAYVKAEANDLNYIRSHQKELRCDSYSNVWSHYVNEESASNQGAPVGKKIILPSSFSGSPRKYAGALSRCNGNSP